MTVITLTEQRLAIILACFLFSALLTSAGCVNNGKTAVESAYMRQLMKASSAHAEKKDFGNAAEDLKIALTIDPEDTKAAEDLKGLLWKRNLEAEKHYKAGMAVLNSNPQKAREELLDALRVRPDFREAVAALRELHLASSEASLQARLKREARIAAVRTHEKERPDEEEDYTDDYSLDIAISSYEDGDYLTAIRQFEKMKTRFPNDPDIQMYLDRSWYNTGLAYFAKNDYKRALSSFARVRKGFERADEYMVKCRQCLRNRKVK